MTAQVAARAVLEGSSVTWPVATSVTNRRRWSIDVSYLDQTARKPMMTVDRGLRKGDGLSTGLHASSYRPMASQEWLFSDRTFLLLFAVGANIYG